MAVSSVSADRSRDGSPSTWMIRDDGIGIEAGRVRDGRAAHEDGIGLQLIRGLQHVSWAQRWIGRARRTGYSLPPSGSSPPHVPHGAPASRHAGRLRRRPGILSGMTSVPGCRTGPRRHALTHGGVATCMPTPTCRVHEARNGGLRRGQRLMELGVPFVAGVGGHGVVATFSRGVLPGAASACAPTWTRSPSRSRPGVAYASVQAGRDACLWP